MKYLLFVETDLVARRQIRKSSFEPVARIKINMIDKTNICLPF